ncbi:MAG: MFS transporter [Lachnospiraceae bacterium]|nr:MFS transporter [Lachnospiraceae bacterium]CDF43952.1 putative ATP synthase F0 A subunit [Roseburia sp. CAG:182]
MKLTKEEKNWILYDVGNSAFTLLIATIMPLYFNYLAEQAGLSSVDYLAYWGYAASVATLFVVFIGPVFGTLADTKGFKKPVFSVALAVGVAACVLMGFAKQWLVFLVIYVIAKTGYSASLIFYDSMLADVTTADRMDQVSSQGYAWGYIGSCVPFVVCLMIVLGAGKLGISMELAMGISFFVTAAWWVLMTVPMLKTYRQKNYVERKPHAFRESFARIGKTFLNVRREKKIFLFLLAFFFYIDGVYTIIDMATAYGSALGLDSTGLLLALLVTQIVAFPCAILFGRLARRFRTEHLITVCVVAYVGIALFACVLRTQTQFWILAIFVGMFQGGIQALSRSYYAKIIPAEQSGEYFGLLDICGKGASFIGTAIVSVVSQLTGDINKGVAMIVVLFVVGVVLFRIAVTCVQKNKIES